VLALTGTFLTISIMLASWDVESVVVNNRSEFDRSQPPLDFSGILIHANISSVDRNLFKYTVQFDLHPMGDYGNKTLEQSLSQKVDIINFR
jgi:hypothetical protein